MSAGDPIGLSNKDMSKSLQATTATIISNKSNPYNSHIVPSNKYDNYHHGINPTEKEKLDSMNSHDGISFATKEAPPIQNKVSNSNNEFQDSWEHFPSNSVENVKLVEGIQQINSNSNLPFSSSNPNDHKSKFQTGQEDLSLQRNQSKQNKLAPFGNTEGEKNSNEIELLKYPIFPQANKLNEATETLLLDNLQKIYSISSTNQNIIVVNKDVSSQQINNTPQKAENSSASQNNPQFNQQDFNQKANQDQSSKYSYYEATKYPCVYQLAPKKSAILEIPDGMEVETYSDPIVFEENNNVSEKLNQNSQLSSKLNQSGFNQTNISLTSMQAQLIKNASCSWKVGELLQTKVFFSMKTKFKAYEAFINTLTVEDKKQEMKFVRCLGDLSYPKTFNVRKYKEILPNYTFKQTGYQYGTNNEWYVNFADTHLFGFYGSSLYAQDELQVLEHPLLAHVLEAVKILELKNKEIAPITYTHKQPTPILITNAHRLGYIDISTLRNPYEYYGNNFRYLSEKDIETRIKKLEDKKTLSNIIAMAAIGYQRGIYTQQQIEFTLKTAFLSFQNASQLTKEGGLYNACVINTGNWGTGAFGNDPTIMVVIQILAALLANIEYLVYHTFDHRGTKNFKDGMKIVEELLEQMSTKQLPSNVDAIIEFIKKKNFQWGVSNGS